MDYESIGTVILRFRRLYRKKMHARLAAVGILHGQPPILEYLWMNDGCIQNELACATKLEPATITSVLCNMERDGLIERRQNDRDRRVLEVFLTEKGKIQRQKSKDIVVEVVKEAFEGFSDDEVERITSVFARMGDNLEANE